jgi:hypothetical protein
MVVNKVDFNRDWARSVKEAAFVKQLLPVVWPELTEAKRKEQLAKAYKLLVDDRPVPEVETEGATTKAKTKQPDVEMNEGAA